MVGCGHFGLEKWVHAQLVKIVGAPVTWKGFAYHCSFEGIQVIATEVSVASTAREKIGSRPLYIDTLQVSLKLFWQAPRLRPVSIRAMGVQADFISWDSLRRNYAFFPPGKGKAAFRIPSIEIHRADFRLYSAAAAGTARLWITSLQGTLDLSPEKIGIDATAHLDGLEVCWPQPLLPSEKVLWHLSAQWDKKRRMLEIYHSQWKGTQARFTFQGKLWNWKVPALYLSGQLPFQGGMLEGQAHWVGKTPAFQGRWQRKTLSLTGCAELPYLDFTLKDTTFLLRARGNYPSLRASWWYPALGLQGEGTLHLSDTSFVGRVTLSAEQFQGHGTLKQDTGYLHAQWKGLPLRLNYCFTAARPH
ncbi:MAG: hypothetical protein ACUVRD_07210, partial [Bacteroidia bacterium]